MPQREAPNPAANQPTGQPALAGQAGPAAPAAPADGRLPDGRTWQLEEVPCDFCGSPQADRLLTGPDRLHHLPGQFGVVACRQCGLVRTSPRPTLESLAAAYPQQYGPHQVGALRAKPPKGLLRWALVNFRGYPLGAKAGPAARLALRPLAALSLRNRRHLGYLPLAGQGRLLDFGCGVGGYVAKMAAAGWQAEGMDLSPDAVRIGRQAGLTMHLGTLPGLDLPADSYDALTMWQALEHVPSPMATLRAALRLLRPGGRLLVAVPRFDSLQRSWFGPAWFPLDLPRHLTHFTRSSLERCVREAGFAVEATLPVRRPANIRHSFAYLAEDTGKTVHRLLSRSRMVVGVLSLWGLLRSGRTGQMICIARKP